MYRKAISLLAEDLNEAVQVAALRGIGFEEGSANRIAALAPSALARALIEQIGKVNWSPTFSIGERNFRYDKQPEYSDLLMLARTHFKMGFFDRNKFERLVTSTAEINTISKALDRGMTMDGSVIATHHLYEPFAAHFLD